jgi:hypothetical protein
MATKARQRAAEPDGSPAFAPVHVIQPGGIYFLPLARSILLLRKSSLRREIREGRLKVCKRCGRYYFLGEQLLDWLRRGELKPPSNNGGD